MEQRLGEEISRLQPSELITVGWQPAQSSIHGQVEALRAVISSVEVWQVEPETASASLKRHFGVSSLDGFGLQGAAKLCAVAAAILTYVQAMQSSALGLLTRLHGYTIGEFMMLDEATRRNLEFDADDARRRHPRAALGVLDDTLTPMGGRVGLLGQSAIAHVAAINRRLDAMQLLHDNTVLRLEACGSAPHSGDLECWSSRAIEGIAQPRDLVGMREVLGRVPQSSGVVGLWGLGDLGESDAVDAPQDPKTLRPQNPNPSPLPPCTDVLALPHRRPCR